MTKELTMPKLSQKEVFAHLKHLTELLTKQTESLNAYNVAKAMEYTQAIVAQTEALEAIRNHFHQHVEVKKAMTRGREKELEALFISLTEKLKENTEKILRLKQVNQRIMKGIALAIMKQVPRGIGYYANGQQKDTTMKDMPLSMSKTI